MNNIKLLNIADIHLRPYKDHSKYKEVFNKLISQIKKEQPKYTLLLGDIYHNKITVSNEAFNILSKFLNAISRYTENIIIIPGNHDTVLNSERLDSISPLIEALNNPKIFYYKESGCYKHDDIVFCVWSCIQNQKSPEVKEWKSEYDPDNSLNYIGLYHGVINESMTPTGFKFVDEGISIKQEFFDVDGFIAGDIHLYQTFEYDNYKGKNKGFGFFCGSLIQQNFGEDLDGHGYVVLEKDEENEWDYELHELENEHNFHTLKLTNFEDVPFL